MKSHMRAALLVLLGIMLLLISYALALEDEARQTLKRHIESLILGNETKRSYLKHHVELERSEYLSAPSHESIVATLTLDHPNSEHPEYRQLTLDHPNSEHPEYRHQPEEGKRHMRARSFENPSGNRSEAVTAPEEAAEGVAPPETALAPETAPEPETVSCKGAAAEAEEGLAPPAPPPLLPGWPVPPGWSAALDSASGQIVFVHARARSTSAPSHKAVLITPENVHALPPPPRADGGNIIMGSPLIQRLPASPAVRPDQLPSQMKQSPQLQPLLSDFERSVYRVGGAEAFADEVASTAREWQATGRLTPAVISETGREHVAGDNTASEMTSASPLPACGASISDRPEARAPGPSDISYGVLPQNTEHDARLALC